MSFSRTACGVGCALSACALWGLDVLVPLLLPHFTAIAVAVARFLSYGMMSLVVLTQQGRLASVFAHGRAVLLQCLLLGVIGEFAYYVLVVWGVQLAGGPVVAMIVGILPITVTLCGSAGLPLRRLSLPIGLLLSGIVLVNGHDLKWTDLIHGRGTSQLLGMACAIVAVLLWTWFAVFNARFLRRNPHISATDWSAMLGVATLLPALIGTPVLISNVHSGVEFGKIGAGGMILGVVVSLYGTVLWNKASRDVPVALLGQLMVVETFASLTYVFCVDGRFPSAVELVGSGLALLGLALGIHAVYVAALAKEKIRVPVAATAD